MLQLYSERAEKGLHRSVHEDIIDEKQKRVARKGIEREQWTREMENKRGMGKEKPLNEAGVQGVFGDPKDVKE